MATNNVEEALNHNNIIPVSTNLAPFLVIRGGLVEGGGNGKRDFL